MNFSNEFTINKIVNFLKSQGLRFGKNTVYHYVEKLPESLADTIKFTDDFGRRIENLVFLELLNRFIGYNLGL